MLSTAVQTSEAPNAPPVALMSGSGEGAARRAHLGAPGLERIAANPDALDAEAICRGMEALSSEAVAMASGAIGATLVETGSHDPPAAEHPALPDPKNADAQAISAMRLLLEGASCS